MSDKELEQNGCPICGLPRCCHDDDMLLADRPAPSGEASSHTPDQIIEACAEIVDECNRRGPYDAICAASEIRDLKGMFVKVVQSGEAPEQLARRFHEAYERLAPSFGYETRKESAKPWEEVPETNRRLMTAVCAEIMGEAKADARAPQVGEEDKARARVFLW